MSPLDPATIAYSEVIPIATSATGFFGNAMRYPSTSPSLLERLRDAADGPAWIEFQARYSETIVRFSRRLGLKLADAEDVRQAVMIRLVGCFGRFRYDRAQGRFRDFLGRIVRNEVLRCRSRLYRDETGAPRADVSVANVAAVDADRVWDDEWVDHHLRLAMRRLREGKDERSFLIFERLLAGDAVDRVAREFDTTPSAVHKVKQRVRSRLRDLVARQIREEDEPLGRATE